MATRPELGRAGWPLPTAVRVRERGPLVPKARVRGVDGDVTCTWEWEGWADRRREEGKTRISLELEPFGCKKDPCPSWGPENSALLPLGPPSPHRAQPLDTWPLAADHALPSRDPWDLELRRPWEVNARGRGSLVAKAKLGALPDGRAGGSLSPCGVTDCPAAPLRPGGTLRGKSRVGQADRSVRT